MVAVKNSTPQSAHNQQPNKTKRLNNVRSLADFKAKAEETGSQRQAAKFFDIPRPTLIYREQKLSRGKSCPKTAEFLGSPEGLAFLHRLVTAILLGVVELSGGGLRVVQTILELSRLDEYVARSTGTLQGQVKAMEEAIIDFGQHETSRLSQTMPKKEIMTSADETFPGDKTILVGMELASNYILIEQIAPDRTYETWDKAWTEALSGLPVTVVNSTTDEGRSLVKCAKDSLGAHHSPDLFHIQQEIGRAISARLRGDIGQCRTAHEQALKQIQTCQRAKERDEISGKREPGRPVDHIHRIAKAEVEEEYAKKDLEEVQARQTQVKEARRKISDSYHPVDLNTGKARSPEDLEKSLNEAFATIDEVAETIELRESGLKKLKKARQMIDSMVITLQFFWTCFAAHLKKYGLDSELKRLFEEILMPAYYIKEAGRKADTAEARQTLNDKSKSLLAQLDKCKAWQSLSETNQKKLQKQALECARLFQRSSSCVEGRNGQLSLRHHGMRRMTERKLAALTVIHNYFIRRPDGTTAAERFFEHKPRDLFEYLVSTLDYPAEPAKRRNIA